MTQLFSVVAAALQSWRDHQREVREKREAGLESLLFAEEMLRRTGTIDKMQLMKFMEMQRIQDENLRSQRFDELMHWIDSKKHSLRA